MISPSPIRRLLVAAMLLLVVACGREPSTPTLDAIPEPIDLDRRDARLVEEYRQLRARLDAAASPEAPRGERVEALLDLGTWHHAYRDYDLAAACYRQAAALEPEHPRWPYYLGRVYDSAGDTDSAREQLERVLDLRPSFVPGLVVLAELEWREGRAEIARQLFARALGAAPKNARAHFGLGQIALEDGDPAGAVEHLEAALDQQPDATSVHYALGRALRATGDAEAAERHLARARIEGNADRVELVLRDPLMQRVQEVSRGRTRTRVRRAERLFEQGQYDASAELLRQALEVEGDSADLRFLLGLVHRRAGDIEAALTELRRTIELQDDHGGAHFQVGLLLDQRGEEAEAETHYRAALRADPGHRQAGFRLGRLLRSQGRYDEAIDAFEDALDAHDTHAAAHFGLAASLVQAGRWPDAVERAEAGLRLQPAAHRLRHLLARLLASAPDDASRDGERALALAQVRADTAVNLQQVETLAMAYAELGRFDEAVRWQQVALDAATRADPAAAEGWIARRLARYRAGRPNRDVWAEGEPTTLSELLPAGADAPDGDPAG